MIFTEGTDLPLVETVIIARPTKNNSLYTQMVGRGLRLHPDKERLILIDCVGTSNYADLCTAPSLLGIDMQVVPDSKKDMIEGDLFELPDLIQRVSDTPKSWIRNVEYVDLWAREQKYNTHNINFFKMPNGDLVLSLTNNRRYVIPAQDELGNTVINGQKMNMQRALDSLYIHLRDNHTEEVYIWDLAKAKRWGDYSATDKQKNIIERRLKGFDTSRLTKLEASQILNRLLYHA